MNIHHLDETFEFTNALAFTKDASSRIARMSEMNFCCDKDSIGDCHGSYSYGENDQGARQFLWTSVDIMNKWTFGQ